jgi:Calcineurin-like phosphoesterase
MATSKPRCLKSRPESAFWSVALSSLAAMRQMSQKAMLQSYLYSYNTFNYRTIQNHADVTRCWREEDTKAAHEQPRRDIGVYEQRVRGSARRPNRKRRIEKPAQTPTLNQRYDIIGDIHGHADELVALLRTLGYAREGGAFRHPNGRKAIFLGDFIDRGPKIREVLGTVRSMVEAGSALAVLGNHEINAMRFHTLGSDGPPLRPRMNRHIDQHRATLEQFPDQNEWNRLHSRL